MDIKIGTKIARIKTYTKYKVIDIFEVVRTTKTQIELNNETKLYIKHPTWYDGGFRQVGKHGYNVEYVFATKEHLNND